MFFLRDTDSRIHQFERIEELREYIEIRHAEEDEFGWIAEINDSDSVHYGCSWSLQIERIG